MFYIRVQFQLYKYLASFTCMRHEVHISSAWRHAYGRALLPNYACSLPVATHFIPQKTKH